MAEVLQREQMSSVQQTVDRGTLLGEEVIKVAPEEAIFVFGDSNSGRAQVLEGNPRVIDENLITREAETHV